MIINDHDESVNKEMIMRLIETWEKAKAPQLKTLHFQDELGLPHDCICLEQPKGNIRLVYAELMKMLG